MVRAGYASRVPSRKSPPAILLALGRLAYLYSTDRNGRQHLYLPRPDHQQAKRLAARSPLLPSPAKSQQKRCVGRSRFSRTVNFQDKKNQLHSIQAFRSGEVRPDYYTPQRPCDATQLGRFR